MHLTQNAPTQPQNGSLVHTQTMLFKYKHSELFQTRYILSPSPFSISPIPFSSPFLLPRKHPLPVYFIITPTRSATTSTEATPINIFIFFENFIFPPLAPPPPPPLLPPPLLVPPFRFWRVVEEVLGQGILFDSWSRQIRSSFALNPLSRMPSPSFSPGQATSFILRPWQ